MLPIPAAKKSTPKPAIVAHSFGSANSPADVTLVNVVDTVNTPKKSEALLTPLAFV